jgi:hypothetical protein
MYIEAKGTKWRKPRLRKNFKKLSDAAALWSLTSKRAFSHPEKPLQLHYCVHMMPVFVLNALELDIGSDVEGDRGSFGRPLRRTGRAVLRCHLLDSARDEPL